MSDTPIDLHKCGFRFHKKKISLIGEILMVKDFSFTIFFVNYCIKQSLKPVFLIQ